MQISSQMGPFSIVPEWVLDRGLSPTALKLYIVMARFADWNTGVAFPSRETLAERMQCSLKTVDRAVIEVVAAECVSKKSRGRYASAVYRVLQVDPRGTDMTTEWTDMTSEETNLSSPLDKNDDLTRTTKQEPLEQEPLNNGFDQFWKIYPKKDDKPVARRSFEKALETTTLDVIIAGAERYRDDPSREAEFTKNGSTWLRAESWNNGPLPARKQKRANWEDAADLARKYREQDTQPQIAYGDTSLANELEADAVSWLKGIDDE